MSDNMPDFDSMSPEELMAWMETLAERQGATEGFTTEKRVDIAEVDPSSVQVEDKYIPYGKTQEEWDQLKAQEDARRNQRRATSQPAAAAPPPAPEPAPAPQPAAAEMDFDSMSPEELMAWMETLAERQGATEGFTTEKRVDIAEVDPSSVQVEDKYIPYGMTQEQWEERRAREDAQRAERRAAQQRPPAAQVPSQPAPPAAPPVAPTPPPQREEPLPAFELPDFTDLEGPTELVSPLEGGAGGLDWLENLAAAQPADFPQMDLSNLGAELESLDFGNLTEDTTDPMDWLNNLVQDQGNAFQLGAADTDEDEYDEDDEALPSFQVPAQSFMPPSTPRSAVSDPTEQDVDPLEWLESLAKRQGADSEEFITGAQVNVPDAQGQSAPGYTDYTFESPEFNAPLSFDTVDELDKPIAAADPDDPVAWLEGLAEAQSQQPRTSSDASEPDVIQRLNNAQDVTAQEMESWMSAMLERGATRTDVPDYVDEDEDEEVVLESSIPDWLIDQIGPPPTEVTKAAAETDFDALLRSDTPVSSDLPDWLQADVEVGEEPAAVQSGIPEWLQDETMDEETADAIFAEPVAPAAQKKDPTSTDEFLIDVDDPWVEAFELERKEGLGDIENVPDWYRVRLQSQSAQAGGLQLAESNLAPEFDLRHGEPEPLPVWLGAPMPLEVLEEEDEPLVAQDLSWLQLDTPDEEVVEVGDIEMPAWLREQVSQEAAVVVAADDEELPDWLRSAGLEVSDDIPEWLMDTLEEENQAVSATQTREEAAPVSVPQVVQPAPQPLSPAPVPVMNINVSEMLQTARQKMQQGDLEASLQAYEAVIRANNNLNDVVGDLNGRVQGAYKTSAAVHRVLGDALMRQGRLQEALDTYRKALNLL
ncbi:MAG: hypothetical protein OHK0046_51530 [Anaerolineae bacterium]